jgi:TRAP-type C4-dicarboxylate transport system substrate-binding protein
MLNSGASRVALATIVAGSVLVVGAGVDAAQLTLKASHQFQGGKGDVRDEMVQIIAREVKAADVGLEIQVFPGASLVKPQEQWQAMQRGQIDIAAFPLDYASGRHPQFGATLMPGLVLNHDRAKRLNDSPFMTEIKKEIEDAGIVVLADAWLAGAFGAKGKCILEPQDAQGLKIRSAGATFAEMWAGAGASIIQIPSNEVYNALQTGVADGTDTSTGSFVSFRLYEQLSCVTAPGENALWFMYEPVLMSKRSFDRLDDKQRQALMAAAQKSEDYFAEESRKLDQEFTTAFEKAGVQVVTMSADQVAKWRDVARQTSYKTFAEQVKGGDQLIDMALAVD